MRATEAAKERINSIYNQISLTSFDEAEAFADGLCALDELAESEAFERWTRVNGITLYRVRVRPPYSAFITRDPDGWILYWVERV